SCGGAPAILKIPAIPHMAKSHHLSEVQPPPSLEAAEKGIALLERGHDVGVTGVDQGPWAIRSEPAVPVRKLLGVARVEASAHRRRAGAFAHAARLYMIEVPAEQPL